MAKLGVNVDHIATIRQARGGMEPDPVTAAAFAELAGANGITVHLREDRRHIQDRDVLLLRRTIQTRLNLEMAATEELTTEGGLDVIRHRQSLAPQIELLQQAGILVSLFVDPDLEQLKASARVKADYVEIHTGAYCDTRGREQAMELGKLEHAVAAGRKLGLGVNAGHGLNYQNVVPVVKIGGIEEFNIGHSIVSRAVLVGLDRAVREMAALVHGDG
jgi:pyridoxine 5-phosphate synthase